MKIDAEECMACGQCAEFCLVGAIEVLQENKGKGYTGYAINQEKCTNCEICLKLVGCPGDAIRKD